MVWPDWDSQAILRSLPLLLWPALLPTALGHPFAALAPLVSLAHSTLGKAFTAFLGKGLGPQNPAPGQSPAWGAFLTPFQGA